MITRRVQLFDDESRGACGFLKYIVLANQIAVFVVVNVREYPTMAFTQALAIGSEVSCTTRLGKTVEGKVIALDEDHHVIIVRILKLLL